MVASERRCVGVDQRRRESEGKAKIEGYMRVSDEEAHQHAHLKYAFINTSFIPSGRSDPHEYEGGMHDVIADIDEEPLRPSPNMISILIKPPPKPHNLWPHMAANITANSSRARPKPEDVSDEEDE